MCSSAYSVLIQKPHRNASIVILYEQHGLLECPNCGKMCNTISALKKHAYEHSGKSGKYACKDCDHAFCFPSQLKSHQKVHLIALEHYCIHCNKSYKSSWELVKHQNVHSGKRWKCQHLGCEYDCHNPRNLCAHMHSHGENTRYHCKNCNNGFNFYMQLKHHRIKACTGVYT